VVCANAIICITENVFYFTKSEFSSTHSYFTTSKMSSSCNMSMFPSNLSPSRGTSTFPSNLSLAAVEAKEVFAMH
jgi:hypothetical protein